MERFQYDREYMKMAMVKHEETFREQVNELHRLYRVQKLLMREMRNHEIVRQRKQAYSLIAHERLNVEDKMSSCQSSYSYRDQRKSPRTLDLEFPAEDYVSGGGAILEFDRESELELTLATGSSRRKKEDTSFTSDSGVSFSSSSAESGGENIKHNQWGLFQMPDMNMSFPSEKKSGYDLEEPVRQDSLKQSPWLFQCFSLNIA